MIKNINALTPNFNQVVRYYMIKADLDGPGYCVHSARATAITNTLDHGADMATVQKWAGHSNISTTRLYDRRKDRAEDSPSYKVSY